MEIYCDILKVISEIVTENYLSKISVQVEKWSKGVPKLAFRIYYRKNNHWIWGKIASLDKLLIKQCIEEKWIEQALEVIEKNTSHG